MGPGALLACCVCLAPHLIALLGKNAVGGECSGHEGLGGEGSETGGAVGASIAAATWFATLPMVLFQQRWHCRRWRRCDCSGDVG